MRYSFLILLFISFLPSKAQNVSDDFEGNGTITSWYGDNCGINTDFLNPFQQGINTSNTVLEYNDVGGQYANVQFEINSNFDLTTKNSFSLKLYVPSSGITGSQPNQISVKLQDKNLSEPWSTQSEIIKSIVLDQWQEIVFDFEHDNYINLDPSSLPPIMRTDFNKIVIQINGENNNDFVLGYLDDFLHFDTVVNEPVYDNLVWFDEFDGNGVINASNWFHQTQLPSGGSWYNGEVQHYTNRIDNAFVNGGFLNIVAKKETFNDQGYTKEYTSARLNSKFAFTYGKVEVRAKLPIGLGTWPAIWMLGQNITESGAYWQTQGFGTTPWPECGEVDIMEHWGNNQNYIQSAMHTNSSSGNTINKGGQLVPAVSTEFHIYTLVWSPDKMVFSVDGVPHYTYNPTVKDINTWPFDAPQYILLNVAIEPTIEPSFTESSMVIDYVRVYQESPLSTINETLIETNASIYPNPVNDTLEIYLDNFNSDSVFVDIIDLKGSKIFNKKMSITDQKLIIDVSFLKQGNYIINVMQNDDIKSILKFIKL